jgi:hypothetical protein
MNIEKNKDTIIIIIITIIIIIIIQRIAFVQFNTTFAQLFFFHLRFFFLALLFLLNFFAFFKITFVQIYRKSHLINCAIGILNIFQICSNAIHRSHSSKHE